MERLASIPGLPPILACAALLATWEVAARLLAIDGLPPASAALAQVPAILGDPEANRWLDRPRREPWLV